MAVTPTAMPWHPAARQAASFDTSQSNSSFKMDVEEITAVIAYVLYCSTVDRSPPPNISTSSSQFLFFKSQFAYSIEDESRSDGWD
jgi:hypothetical protein